MTDAPQRPWAEHIRYMARVEVSHIFAEEARNPPRCESAKAYREGAPLTEALEIARNVYAARTGRTVMDLSDESVFANAKAGSLRAMNLLLARLRSRVLHAATGKPVFLSIEDAEDLTQEVLLKVSQRLGRVTEYRNLIPFALRITHDLGINLAKKEARRSEVIVFDSELADSVMAGNAHDLGDGNYRTPPATNSDDTSYE